MRAGLWAAKSALEVKESRLGGFWWFYAKGFLRSLLSSLTLG